MSELITGYHQITFDEYLSAKQEITTRLMDMSEDFVVIGYLLRQIEANKAYERDGYTSLKDFAKAEYNMSETAVSRFMSINKRFSENGFGRNLLPELRGYGYSKLSEMLTLNDEDMELVTQTTTVAEIREIKAFEREEKELKKEEIIERVEAEVVSKPVENVIESGENVENSKCEAVSDDITKVPEREYSDLEKIIIEFFRNDRDLLTEIYQMSNFEDIVERINPSGNRTFKHKIYMLFMYGYSEGVILKQMAKGNTKYTWQQFIEAAVDIYSDTYTDHDSVWENFYGVTCTKTENLHVSEDKPAEEKTTQDREKSSNTEIKQEKKEVTDPSQKETPAAVEEELPGQMYIEDYPEALPEGFATSQDREKSSNTETSIENTVGRLTWYKPDGTWGLKNYDIHCVPKELYPAIYKLYRYEKIGLSPEEIEDMLNEKHNTEE